jgi:predicted DNA-binding protein (MmcQ/YjbR family)
MNVDDIWSYCLAKSGVEEGFPFGEETLVFKTGGKIFLLVGLNNSPLQFNAKCDPERAVELREQYDCVRPGYHMNKIHCNTVIIDCTISCKQLKELIDHSFELVGKVKSKTKTPPAGKTSKKK